MSETESYNKERVVVVDEEFTTKQKHRRMFLWSFALLIPIILPYLWGIAIAPPKDFLPNTYIEIPRGTLAETAIFLKDHSLIRSETIFLFTIQRAGKEKGIQSGKYFFKDPASVFEVARRVMRAEYGIKQLKVTLPEGITSKEMANILSTALPAFDSEIFQSLTKEKEGYLFPDTYFFYTTATSGEIVIMLQKNFIARTENLRFETEKAQQNWENVVTVASILEEEATTEKDRRLVSGIIWKRLKANMPLQIDATLGYITGKGSLDLTATDLKSDSPYNTYTHKGLPPTPISNPGLEALTAALYPESSAYLYYLSDKSGVIHYAKTFEEHKLNKSRYLR